MTEFVSFSRALLGRARFLRERKLYKMNKAATLLRVVPLLLLAVLLLSACTPVPASWENALYKKDTTLGEGAVTVTVKVTAEDKTVTLTLKTDDAMLDKALLAAELVRGKEAQYGLMISHVNGIRADYDLDGGYYWKVLVNGETAPTGVSYIPVTEGTVYEFVRTNQW